MHRADYVISQSKYLQKLLAIGILYRKESRGSWTYRIGYYWVFDSFDRVWNMREELSEPIQDIESVEQCELAAKAVLLHSIKIGDRI